MSVATLFALVGGIILTGFLANLLFRLTRIPTVLLLIGTGIVLGPATGWLQSDALVTIAPFFGAMALVIILFEGGLELEIEHVVRQAPRAAVLAVVVFAVSLASVALFAHLVAGLPWLIATLLGAILGATSPAICIPVVSGLSVRDEVKTIVKLESALGDVLLIVSVVLLLDVRSAGGAGTATWAWQFARSLLVALAVSSVAGVLWSRLIAWIGHEPLAYMLTLGIVFLLYFAVEELGGSAAIAVLVFGLMLANMGAIAGRVGPWFRRVSGVDLREEQFVLNQFIVRITAELSFLVRTFFFVYLGVLVDLASLTWRVGLESLGIVALLLASRRVGIGILGRRRMGRDRGERQAIMALAPRGLATAVMAFLALRSGIEGTTVLPVYVFVVIILTNVYMTGGVLFAERLLRADASGGTGDVPEQPAPSDTSPGLGIPTLPSRAPVVEDAPAPRRAPRLFAPGADLVDEPDPLTFTDWVARGLGLRPRDREAAYGDLIGASYLRDPLFWVQAGLGGAICALGLILDQIAIIIGGALIVPLARPVMATGLALASGDIYLLVKSALKLLLFAGLVTLLSAVMVGILPFGATTPEIATRTRPTILDFLVALFAGMSAAAFLSARVRGLYYLPGAVVAITLLPPLCVMGFGVGLALDGRLLWGGSLLFTANLFANALGTCLVLLLVGLPRAADLASIRAWKEQELSRPVVQAIFGRLGLQRAIGRTGSARSRIAVVGGFLLVLLIPLQSAFNALSQELRIRQAVAQVQRMFNVSGRSSVIDTASVILDDEVQVRIHIATNALFDAGDIARFEERTRDRTGRATRLDLVQTLSDVGQADTIRALLLERTAARQIPSPRAVADAVRDLRVVVRQAVSDVPLPDSVRVVGVVGDAFGSGEPRLEVVYIAAAALQEDTQAILRRIIEDRTKMARGHVALRWIPDRYRIRVSTGGQPLGEDRIRLEALGHLLAMAPGVVPVLHVPSGRTKAAERTLHDEVERLLGVSDLTSEAAPASEPGVAVVQFMAPPAR